MGIRSGHLRETGRRRRKPKRGSKGPTQPSSPGAFSLDRLTRPVGEKPLCRLGGAAAARGDVGTKHRFFVSQLLPKRPCQNARTGAKSKYENGTQTQSRVRLVGPMRKHPARNCVLRVSLCG